jgi:hypothetical protein
MQTLGVVPRLWPDLLAGRKTSTIRWREGPVTTGLLRYVCDGDASASVVVLVTKVTRMKLGDAAAYLGREEEWPPPVMLAGMREHYPDITLDDEVDIVEHLTPAETLSGLDG